MEIEAYAARTNHDTDEIVVDLEFTTDGNQSHTTLALTLAEAKDLLTQLQEALKDAEEASNE